MVWTAIESGQSNINVDGRSYAIFLLRGATIHVSKTKERNSNTLHITIPPLDTDRYRRLFVRKPDGGSATVDIPDMDLSDNEALIYNLSNNTLTTKYGTWGNISVSANEYVLMYNNLGRLSGELSKYVIYEGYTDKPSRVYEVLGEQITSAGSTQGIFIAGGRLFACSHSNDEHTDFSTIDTRYIIDENETGNVGLTHNFGHMNAPSYSESKDALIVGNGSKDYDLPCKGWIIPNLTTHLVNGNVLDINTTPNIELDLSEFVEAKCQLCWGLEGSDDVYMMTNDNRTLRKLRLGKTSGEYDGTYEVLGKWESSKSDILGGMMYVDGVLYTGVKGEYGVRKCIPMDNGTFDTEYIHLSNKQGDMQGLAEKDGVAYLFTSFRGYTIDVVELQ